MYKKLDYYMGGLLSFTARSLGNHLEEVFDRITEEGYLVQRGDLTYQTIPEDFLKNLDRDVLNKLLSIDDRLIHLLETYVIGRDPNKLDLHILTNSDSYLAEIRQRIKCVEKAILCKDSDPRHLLKKIHKSMKRMPYKNELERATINSKYKAVINFFIDFCGAIETAEDTYLNSDLRNMAIEIIDQLESHCKRQHEDRINKLEEFRSFFSDI